MTNEFIARARPASPKNINNYMYVVIALIALLVGGIAGYVFAPRDVMEEEGGTLFNSHSTAITQKTLVIAGTIESFDQNRLSVLPGVGTDSEKQENKLFLDVDENASVYIQQVVEGGQAEVSKQTLADLKIGDMVTITVSVDDGNIVVRTISVVRNS